MKQNPFILFSCIFAFFYSHSQNIKFDHYNDNNGLSHNSVRHIVQDRKGFLWFGTYSGLNRFDGYQFKTYLSSSTAENKLMQVSIYFIINNRDSKSIEFRYIFKIAASCNMYLRS